MYVFLDCKVLIRVELEFHPTWYSLIFHKDNVLLKCWTSPPRTIILILCYLCKIRNLEQIISNFKNSRIFHVSCKHIQIECKYISKYVRDQIIVFLPKIENLKPYQMDKLEANRYQKVIYIWSVQIFSVYFQWPPAVPNFPFKLRVLFWISIKIIWLSNRLF